MSTEALQAPFRAPAGISLLVVDDDAFIARLLEIELSAAGYDVRTAGSGDRALQLAFERCPDLILADVMMPNMDGFELTRQLRMDERTAGTKVILEEICTRLAPEDPESARRTALLLFTMLVGSMQLARALSDKKLSNAVLEEGIRSAQAILTDGPTSK